MCVWQLVCLLGDDGWLGKLCRLSSTAPTAAASMVKPCRACICFLFLYLQVMMDWLGKLCGLPDKFISAAGSSSSSSADQAAAAAAATSAANGSSSSDGTAAAAVKSGGGVIQGTSSEAVLVAMLAGRARALQGQPPEAALKLVAYGTDQVNDMFV
jgi:hypothetical protein